MKLLYTFLLIIFVIPFSYSQVKFGSKAGISISTFNMSESFSPEVNNSYKAGFYMGLTAKTKINEKMFLSLELTYVQKGTNGLPGSAFNEKLLLPYLNLPILFNYNLHKNLNIYIGPEAGLLLKAKIKKPNEEYDVSSNFQSFDLGLLTGISYHFAERFYLDARLIEGLTRIQNLVGLAGSVDQDMFGRNRTIQLGVGYNF